MHDIASIDIRPIGLVETTIADDDIARQRRNIISDIIVFDEFAPALAGLNEYSHIIVLFWMDRARPSIRSVIHPRGDESLPLTGVLASRGRGHPNPIGLAVVELVEQSGTRLRVRRLDAFHGTPIIDIKPYDHYDVYTDLRLPDWLKRRQLAATPQAAEIGS